MIVPVLLLKPRLPPTIPSVLICGSVGLLCYMAVALTLAMDRPERAIYLAKIRQIFSSTGASPRPSRSPAPAASAASSSTPSNAA
jgi:hypothetical protein